jgi:hypothetical protein
MFGFFKKRRPVDPITALGSLLWLQVRLEYESFHEMFSTLMTNAVAAGYVFGFIDAWVQMNGRGDPKDPLPCEICKAFFGDRAGYMFWTFSLHFQTKRDFQIGRQSGGEDFVAYVQKKIPPMGLSRIMLFTNMLEQAHPERTERDEACAKMVKRTLDHPEMVHGDQA